MQLPSRIIGELAGHQPGPLLIAIGGLHGNEPAGVLALEGLMAALEGTPALLRGTLLAIRGNRQALLQQQRYLSRDLNRCFTSAMIARVRALPSQDLTAEDQELRELIDLVDDRLLRYQPTELIVVDLHTTSSHGGIFAIPADDERSLALSTHMHAPVIRGMLHGLQGTTLHYFQSRHFDYPTTAITFESGQHTDPASAQRACSTLINLLEYLAMVPSGRLPNTYDMHLQRYSMHLPPVLRLAYRHHVDPSDGFRMRPGFGNFSPINIGEVVATDRHGTIVAPQTGYLLMPLYQPLGEDGFFLVVAE